MAKYMSKNEKDIPNFRGRVWGCSLKISRAIDNSTMVSADRIHEVMHPVYQSKVETLYIETPKNEMGKSFTVAQVFLFNTADWVKIQGSFLYGIFRDIVIYLRSGDVTQLTTEGLY